MKLSRLAAALFPVALAACGGTNASSFQDAAPSYSSLAMDVTADATAGGTTGMTAYAAPAPVDALAVTAADTCHPHLFLRTADIAWRVNRHLWRFLRHVEMFAARAPDKLTSGDATWQRTHGTIEVKWTVTKVSEEVYDWLLQARPVGGTDWTTVFSGEIDRTGATAPHQGKGTAKLDLTALHAVDPTQPFTGVIDTAFESFADHRKLVVDAVAVTWEPPVDAAGMAWFAGVPENAHYVYYRAPGKGGSFKAHDSMVFLCPPPAVGAPPPADVKLLSRWFVGGSPAPSYQGRSDAVMTGGQLDAASRVVGLTCQTAAFDATPTAEAYWLMKEESATSPFATIAVWGPAGNEAACAAAFGPVPTAADGANDFDFTSVNFDSADPAPFPGGP